MNIQNLGLTALKIGSDGRWSAAGRWLAADDGGLSGELVRRWAGNPGDFLKVAADGGNAVTTDPAYRVEAVDIKFLDHYRAEVTLTARQTEFAPQLSQPVTEGTDQFNQISRTAGWLVPRAKLAEVMPAPGTEFDWDNQPFLCDHTLVKYLDADTAEFTLTARPAAVAQLGLTNFYVDDSGFEFAAAVWLVPERELADFLTGHTLYGAAAWAGTDYHLVKVKKEPEMPGRRKIELTAKKITDRMLHAGRSEEFVNLNDSGEVERKIVWTSSWQIKAASLSDFYRRSGTAPVSWADAHTMITKIIPQAVSPVEYLLTMTAEDLDNPGLFERDTEDNTNLGSRKDASVDMADFFVSAQMAGYSRDPDGVLQPIPDWDASQSCPFTASAPLDIAFADSSLKTFVVHESIYASGRAGNQVNNMANWAASRIFNGTVAGHSGNYLKIRQICSETRDRSGSIFTRISRSYQLAPGNLRWNSQYWANH